MLIQCRCAKTTGMAGCYCHAALHVFRNLEGTIAVEPVEGGHFAFFFERTNTTFGACVAGLHFAHDWVGLDERALHGVDACPTSGCGCPNRRSSTMDA